MNKDLETTDNLPCKRILVMPEYGKSWVGTVLRYYAKSEVVVVLPDDYTDVRFDVRCVDLEYTGWASLDNAHDVIIPDDISSKDDYDYYSAVRTEQKR